MPVANGRTEELADGYHESLFAWHCRTFYPLHKGLSGQELDYLRVCFRLATKHKETPPWGYQNMSYYSYSHRVAGNTVNSSRFAYGSIEHPRPALEAALPVLHSRNIVLDPFYLDSPDSSFYGLGWDLVEREFKVYFLLRDLRLIHDQPLLNLLATLEDVRQSGLVSFTFLRNQLYESKVYAYPLSELGDEHNTIMATTRRGIVLQTDISDVAKWIKRINEVGRRIIYKYEQEADEPLDTIAYSDPDHYTLYFP